MLFNSSASFVRYNAHCFSTIHFVQVLIDARDKLGISWEDSSRQSQADYIMTFDRYMSMDPSTFLLYVPHIRELWKDVGIHQAYDRRREFQLVCHLQDKIKNYVSFLSKSFRLSIWLPVKNIGSLYYRDAFKAW